MVSGEVFHCGGGIFYAGGQNYSECWMWSVKEQDWVQRDLESLRFPINNIDSVVVPGLGWWLISGFEGNDTTWFEQDPETLFLLEEDRSTMHMGPRLNDRNISVENHCAVQIQRYYTAIIGGDPPGFYNTTYYHRMIGIFDWYRNDWTDLVVDTDSDFQGWSEHECEVIVNPECGHETVVIMGGRRVGHDYDLITTTNTGDYPTKVMLWDTQTNEFSWAEEQPCTGRAWTKMEAVRLDRETLVVMGGRCKGEALDDIWTYTYMDGFTHIGNMQIPRYGHAATVVWGDGFKCPETEIGPNA